jgi:hypothetical protein
MRKQPLERFIEKISPEPNTGCWLWTGSERSFGYGCCAKNGKNYPAHRAAYELFKGPIPSGLEIDHLCHVTFCVNPDHLEPVTRQVNIKRRRNGGPNKGQRKANTVLHPNTAKNLMHNKRKTHCPHGHEYSGDNLKIRPCGRRECKICKVKSEKIRWSSR